MRYFSAVLLTLLLATASLTAAAATALTETGSSLLYPILVTWIADYTKTRPGVTIEAASTRSGYGLDQAKSGGVSFGGSDAYLNDSMAHSGMFNIPLAISAQEIAYNLPGLPKDQPLHLSGDVLAAMYSGAVQFWDDPAVSALNHEMKLSHAKIVTIRRSDASGDTFLFTQFLTFSSSRWKNGPKFGTSIAWPNVDGEQTAKGNARMVELCANPPNSIAYVGISFLEQTRAHGLGIAALQNHDGKFVMPTDARMTLIFAPGADSYPIVNYEYAIVKKSPSEAKSVGEFLSWVISPTGGNAASHLDAVHFVPLPENVRKISEALIAKATAP